MDIEALKREYLNKLKELSANDIFDEEIIHIKADALLCELLKKLGFDEMVKEFEDLPKCYA